MRGVLVLALLSLSLVRIDLFAAGPYIPPRSILNAASLTPPGLPGGSIARGSRFQISGVAIGPSKAREDSRFPLSRSLGGVTITATVGKKEYACWPIYVSSSVVKAILPSAVPAGTASLLLTFNGKASNRVAIQVVEHNPGLFSVNGLGYGPGRVFDANGVDHDSEHEHRNSLGKAHRRGWLASVLGTGFGASRLSDYLPPPHHDSSRDVDILVGGVPAQKFFVRKSFFHPGLDEASFRVPDDAPPGCYVPVQVVVNGVASNVVTMAIRERGRECADAFNPASGALRDGGNVAFALLSRVVIQGLVRSAATDQALAAGRRLHHNDHAFERLVSLPPPGTCTMYSTAQDFDSSTSPASFAGSRLFVGNLRVSDSSHATRDIPFFPLGFYEATWGRNDPMAPLNVPPPAFLNPGAFVFSGTGAGKVGAFSVQRTLGPPPSWTNAAETREVMRSADLTVAWSGTGARQVFVVGSAFNHQAGATALFECLAAPGSTSLIVPAMILSRLPAAWREDRSGTGGLQVGAFAEGTPAAFSAIGLDSGVLFLSSATAQAVRYK